MIESKEQNLFRYWWCWMFCHNSITENGIL